MPTTRFRRWITASLAALSLLAATGCEFNGAYDLPLPGGTAVSAGDAFEITAEFDDVLNIVPKSPVMVDDVPVGQVTRVQRNGWNATVTMLVRKDVQLPDNAIADVRQTSLLGEKYIALEPPAQPSPERLGDGDRIPLASTGRNPEVEEVLGALSFLLSGGGVGQLSTISSELNAVMTGRTDQLKDLLGNLDGVVETLNGQRGDIIRAMESLNGLASTLNAQKDTISGALQTIPPAVKVLHEQHDELIGMLKALDRLGVVGTRVIGASKENLLTTLRDLQPVLTQLNKAGAALPGGLSLLLSFPFPESAQEIVKGDFANTEIKLDINLENFIGSGPLIPLPPVGEILTDLQKCLSSGSLLSTACAKFLTNINLLNQLQDACRLPANASNPVCKALLAAPLGGISLLSGTSRTTSTDLYGVGL